MSDATLMDQVRGHWTRNSFVISIVVHLLFVSFAVAYVAVRIHHKPQSTLIAEEPPRPALELRKLEMRVKVADLQKNSARPKLQPRLVAMSPGEIALPEIKTVPKAMERKIKRDIAKVGVSGFGSGIGGGLGTGIGGGSGDINFFGLKGAGEKVCLIVDVSMSMCEDERGGLRGYQKLKQEVANVIRGLNDGCLFNVIAFEDSVARCWRSLRSSSPATRQEAEDWVSALNRTEGPYGLQGSNYSPGEFGLEAAGGSSRLDLALTAAFEQGADTIFVISDGKPMIRKADSEEDFEEVDDPGREVTDAEIRDWEKAMEEWRKEEEKRKNKGIGPSLREGRNGPPRRPQSRPPGTRRVRVGGGGMWSTDDILAHIQALQKALYLDRGRTKASVNAVGYEVDKETRSFLRELARDNDGKYRSISGM